MQIHLVLGLNGAKSAATLKANILREYDGRSKELGHRSAWLVADQAPARAVSDKLGINVGEGGISALVTTMADYYGRAEPELWTWIKMQWENQQDGTPARSAVAH